MPSGEGRPCCSADAVRTVGDARAASVQLLHRTADAAAPGSYDGAARVMVRCSPVVTPDETGWRLLNAILHWLWAFATPETTVYAICDGSGGSPEAAGDVGAAPDLRSACWMRDGWVAYRGFKKAPHANGGPGAGGGSDLGVKDLTGSLIGPTARGRARCRRSCVDGLALRRRARTRAKSVSTVWRRPRGAGSPPGSASADRGPKPPVGAPAERFAKHLANEFPAVFLVLVRPCRVDVHQLAGRTGHPTRSGHA